MEVCEKDLFQKVVLGWQRKTDPSCYRNIHRTAQEDFLTMRAVRIWRKLYMGLENLCLWRFLRFRLIPTSPKFESGFRQILLSEDFAELWFF